MDARIPARCGCPWPIPGDGLDPAGCARRDRRGPGYPTGTPGPVIGMAGRPSRPGHRAPCRWHRSRPPADRGRDQPGDMLLTWAPRDAVRVADARRQQRQARQCQRIDHPAGCHGERRTHEHGCHRPRFGGHLTGLGREHPVPVAPRRAAQCPGSSGAGCRAGPPRAGPLARTRRLPRSVTSPTQRRYASTLADDERVAWTHRRSSGSRAR